VFSEIVLGPAANVAQAADPGAKLVALQQQVWRQVDLGEHPSTCYRCRASTEHTAVVGRLTRRREHLPIRACEACTVRLERAREMAAERYGWPYLPGTPSRP